MNIWTALLVTLAVHTVTCREPSIDQISAVRYTIENFRSFKNVYDTLNEIHFEDTGYTLHPGAFLQHFYSKNEDSNMHKSKKNPHNIVKRGMSVDPRDGSCDGVFYIKRLNVCCSGRIHRIRKKALCCDTAYYLPNKRVKCVDDKLVVKLD